MALYYTVWGTASETANGPVLNENKITVDGTSTPSPPVVDPSAEVPNQNRLVRLRSDEACFVTWGETPVALNDGTDGRPLDASNPEYFLIPANQKLAVIEKV